jgi:phosphoribosylglycinamide formyltransferase 1
MLNTTFPRVAILCSDRAPGVDELLCDPARGDLYDVVLAVTTNRDLPQLDALVDAGITCIARPQPPKDLVAREAYDAETTRYLKAFGADLVVLCCYLRILTRPMLDAFPGRIINLHDSDLAITNSRGTPRYVGLRSTRDAIAAGERETRATAHWVTEEVDGGPILLRSDPFPVRTDSRMHRELVIRSAWGPLMREAIHLIARREAAMPELLQATA